MKKVLFLLLASFLVLTACGNKEESKSEDKKETKSSDKTREKEDKKSNGEKESNEDKESDNKSNEEAATQDDNSKEQTTQESTQSQETKKVDVSNITDRATLESVIYGNYSEMEKINAYNSAVANGIIPQGNVMEGPAIAAYESSLKVESGEVESIYEKNNNENNKNIEDQNTNENITIHEDGRRTYKDELGHDKNILTPEEQARQDEENDISPQERKEVEESLAND